jgi:hypothetical protein
VLLSDLATKGFDCKVNAVLCHGYFWRVFPLSRPVESGMVNDIQITWNLDTPLLRSHNIKHTTDKIGKSPLSFFFPFFLQSHGGRLRLRKGTPSEHF